MKIQKMFFTFCFLFFAFLGGVKAYSENFKVDTTWVTDSKNTAYSSCLLDDSQKWGLNYEKIDNMIDILDDYYNYYAIVVRGACSPKVILYVFQDEVINSFHPVYTIESGRYYEGFTLDWDSSVNKSGYSYGFDFDELDTFTINDVTDGSHKSAGGLGNYRNAFYSSNTHLLYYSSFDINVCTYNMNYSVAERTFYLNNTEFVFTNTPLKIQTVYEILHPKADISYNFHAILNDDDIVENVEARIFPTVLNDSLYNYVYSVDGENWTSVLLGDKNYFSFLTGENKKVYVKIISKKTGSIEYEKTITVPDLIGKTKEEVGIISDSSDNIFTDGDSSSSSDNFSTFDDAFSSLISYMFPYFQFAFDFYDLIKGWSFDSERDGDCFTIDSNGNKEHFSCTPLSNVSFDLSFLPYGVGEKIGTIHVGRSFIMWFDEYRGQLFFIEKLLMITCVIVALLHFRVRD